jgi:Flp pilus assembly protein TadD
MMPDDQDRDISGAGSRGLGGKKDRLEIEAENLNDDLSYEPSARTIDIEQELEKALADDEGGPVTADDLDFNFPKVKKSSSLGKFAVPAIVLVAFAGAAGFIALHPEVLAMKTHGASPVSMAYVPPASSSNIVLAQASPSDLTPPAGAAPITAAASPNDTAAAAAAAVPSISPPSPGAPASPSSPSMSAPLLAQATKSSSAPVSAAPLTPADTGAAPGAMAKSSQANIPAAPPALSAPDSGASKNDVAGIASDMNNLPSGVSDGEPVAVTDGQALHPSQAGLQSPSATASQPVGAATGMSSSPPVRSKKAVKDSDAYYDADATMSTPGSGVSAGPRKVDPNKEPGQKLVIVTGVRKSSDIESQIVAADRALKLERYDAALDMYNNLYVKNSHDPRILMGRAVAQEKLGMTDSAIQSYDDLLEIAPNNADAMVNMLGLLKKKDPAGALQRMLQLEDKYPNHPGLAAQIGIAEGEAGNYQEAMRYLGRAASLEPNNPQDPFNMAVLADRQGDTTDAIKFYEQALTVDSENSGGAQTIPRESVYDRLAILRRRS